MSLSEKKLRKLIRPSLQEYLYQLADELEDSGLSVFQKKPVGSSEANNTSTSQEKERNSSVHFRNNLNAFKFIVKRIHATSKMQDATNASIDFLSILKILKTNNVYDAGWTRHKELSDKINVNEQVAQDGDNATYIQKAFEKAKVNFQKELIILLFGYTKYKLSDLYKLNDYSPPDLGIDLSTNHPLDNGGYVLFEIKIDREDGYKPNRDHVFQLYENLKRVDEYLKNSFSYIALVAYSPLDATQFESLNFKFQQFATELDIPASYLQRMSLIPATVMEPITVEVGLKKFRDKLTGSIFSYDFKSSQLIKNNHEVLPRFFNANKKRIDITITPQETLFWRFGFSLTDEKVFIVDREAEDFHANPNTIDIHICVGNMLPNHEWQDSDQLTLTPYKAGVPDGKQESYLSYKQEPVTFRVVFKDGQVSATIIVAGKNLGTKTFMCNKKYVHFMAWCDHKEYHLNTQFNVHNL
jgi:hypothetical protein